MRSWVAIMTNEQYLYLSYFAAVIIGLSGAAISIILLHQPMKQAVVGLRHAKAVSLMKKFLSPWLISAVVLGFISVSYMDCSHDTYKEIVATREYLTGKTQEQAAAMSRYLAVALTIYTLLFTLSLWAGYRRYFKKRPFSGLDRCRR